MTFGAKPMGPPPIRPRPPSRGEVAFAIGSRALITPTGTATTQVQLLDEDGMPVDRRLPVDAQVIITAWRPRRSAPPRYRVCSSEQVEGWIDAANLRRLPPPPPPAPMAVTGPPKPAPKPAPKALGKRVAKAPVKPAAPVPVTAKAGPVPKASVKGVLAPKATVKGVPAPKATVKAVPTPKASAKAVSAPKARAKAGPSASRARTSRTPSAAAARSHAPKAPTKPKRSRPASKRAR